MSEHICSVPVADRMYDVELVEGRIFVDGKEHLSLTDHESETISVSDTVPVEDRAGVVAVAVAWAWRSVIRGQQNVFPIAYDVNRDDQLPR